VLDVIISPPASMLEANYREFGLDIRSFREPLKRSIQQVMAPSFAENFDVGGRPPWEELSAGTIARKGSGEILVDTGKLRNKVGQLNNWVITQSDAQMAQVSGVPFAGVHQFGSPSRHIPARPFALMQDEDVTAVEQVFVEWLSERATARGLNDGGIIDALGLGSE
jgi:phage gpG-like protein